MTLHCAVSYFDEKSRTFGYLIGSDSNAQIPELEETDFVNKAIIGKRSIGFIRGKVTVRSDDPVKNFAKRLKSLEGCIDKIEEGQDLPKKMKMHEGEQFYLLMAKRSKDLLGLYSVRVGYESHNRCKKMHEMRFDSYETIDKSKVLYAPLSSQFVVADISARVTFDQGMNLITEFLTLSTDRLRKTMVGDDYEPGPANIYKIDQKKIEKIV